jgi:RNA methyltransferase, TrmH family
MALALSTGAASHRCVRRSDERREPPVVVPAPGGTGRNAWGPAVSDPGLPLLITSKANPLLMAVRKAVRDGGSYRRGGWLWLEGDHLCAAAAVRGVAVAHALVAEAAQVVRVPDGMFKVLSSLESPADIGFLLDLPQAPQPDATLDCVVLDRVQDAGNVGSILRSAAALGVPQVLALKGTAALWSPKVLRAGMGAHFALRLVEGLSDDDLLALGLNLVGTSSHGGEALHLARLPRPAAWLMGHEGQGVSATLAARSRLTVGIPQPGGEESLNVAAAAAICLYEALRQRL